MLNSPLDELDILLSTWTDNGNRTKKAFVELKSFLADCENVQLSYISRPGISYSLRAAHTNQTSRPLFAMVDIIDDDPEDRWLSICFYRNLITDPEELGDEVPGGLLGEDACCFDIDSWDEKLVTYVKARLHEAWQGVAPGE